MGKSAPASVTGHNHPEGIQTALQNDHELSFSCTVLLLHWCISWEAKVFLFKEAKFPKPPCKFLSLTSRNGETKKFLFPASTCPNLISAMASSHAKEATPFSVGGSNRTALCRGSLTDVKTTSHWNSAVTPRKLFKTLWRNPDKSLLVRLHPSALHQQVPPVRAPAKTHGRGSNISTATSAHLWPEVSGRLCCWRRNTAEARRQEQAPLPRKCEEIWGNVRCLCSTEPFCGHLWICCPVPTGTSGQLRPQHALL